MFNTEWIIRVPEWAIVLSHRYRRLARKARNATGFEPAFEEVCAAMNLKEDKRACLRQALLVFSTEFHPKGEGLLAKESEAEPDLEREQDRQEKVEQLISRLTPKQANVIRLHYGFASPEGRSISLSDIGRAEGRQFQAIQQIRNRAIKTLRQIAGDDLRRLA
jgi:DNA-directed RNA polymerase sigma subunit (sigma70/sigma32)